MQRVQRKFGRLLKRSADGVDVGTVLQEFNNVDKALTIFIESSKAWRDAWDETLRTQLYVAESLHTLYKPIEVEDDPDDPVKRTPAPTPKRYLDKSKDLQAIYATLSKDLTNDVNSIEPKLLRPAMDAKNSMKALKKTIKRREDCKLDYERYNSRVDAVRRKETRSAREENALMKHESDLARATADYQAADEQLTKLVPPVLDALSVLVPDLLAIQIMMQHSMVGHLYTVLHEYCQTHRLPSPAPAMETVVSTFEAEYTPLRQEIETNFKSIANGKAVHQPMSLPDKKQGTVTGLGLRNTFQRRTSSQGSGTKPAVSSQLQLPSTFEEQDESPPSKPPRPGSSSMRISSSSRLNNAYTSGIPEDEEAPPMKPPRPGAPPTVDLASKPRISSSSKPTPPNMHTTGGASPSPYSVNSSSSSTPFLTPASSMPNLGGDYFSRERKLSTSSGMSGIAGKKKPPPPPPKPKRFPSIQSEYVTALYDFGGQGGGDLSFREGERIKVVKKTDSTDDWWEGELRGVVGSFPANYVQVG